MKKLIAILLSIMTIISITFTAYAQNNSTYSNNVSNTVTSFTISTSGKATVSNNYTGKSGVTKSATITTKVQKKVGLIWVTVSGGSWTDKSTAVNYSKNHSVQLSSKGTYRAYVKFVISGTGGSDDEITKKLEKTYS